MIQSELYPTVTVSYNGELEITDKIFNLRNAYSENIGSPYYIGFIPFSEFPKCASVKTANYSNGVSFNEIKTNHSWGFLYANNTIGKITLPYSLRMAQRENTSTALFNYDNYYNFINKIKMANVNYLGTVLIKISCIIVPTEDIDDNNSTPYKSYPYTLIYAESDTNETGYVSLQKLYSVINNEISLTAETKVTFNFNNTSGITRTFRPIYYNDFSEMGIARIESTENGGDYTLFACVSEYQIKNKSSLSSLSNTGNEINIINDIVPFFESDTEDTHIIYTFFNSWDTDIRVVYYRELNTMRTLNAGEITIEDDKYFFCNIPYDLLLEDFKNAPVSNSVNRVIKGEYFIIGTGYNTSQNSVQYRIYSHFDLKDIYYIMNLLHKIKVGAYATNQLTYSNTYTTDYSTSLFDENDTPKNERIELDFNEIASELRPWQLPDNDITVNEYNPEDKPDYNEGDDSDDDTDSGGDDIRDTDFALTFIGAGNNFITSYALSSAGISDMGKKLWASLSDSDYWETVGTVFKNDFSINPADMMRYFVSLRYFPFDLKTQPHSISTGIYLGRAVAPLSPSSGIEYPIRLTKSIAELNGGSVTINRYYNDFRDYDPCTIVQISVPYCGIVDLPTSEVMGKTLYLSYKIDLQTGAMLAVVSVSSDTHYVIVTLAGTCGASIPITSNNNIEFLQRIATVGQAVISGGSNGSIKGLDIGNKAGGAEVAAIGAGVGAVVGSAYSGISALAGLPPVTVHKQGNASGFANLGGVNNAFVTITRQRYEIPDNYGHTVGYATDFKETIGNLSGFTVCTHVDTTGIPCSQAEREEIKRLLEGGVYV